MARPRPKKREFVGGISTGIPRRDNLVEETIAFVFGQLVMWRDDRTRPSVSAEKDLNSQLCKFLSVTAGNEFSMVRFAHEEPQGIQRSADVGATPTELTWIDAVAYTIYDPFLVFECKRLPAAETRREREYVTQTTAHGKIAGGIQRFKLGLHARHLRVASMIGYIQKCDARHWHKEINRWITEMAMEAMADECEWSDSECLGTLNLTSAGSASCKSTHSRRGNAKSDVIQLTHLWIEMTSHRKDVYED